MARINGARTSISMLLHAIIKTECARTLCERLARQAEMCICIGPEGVMCRCTHAAHTNSPQNSRSHYTAAHALVQAAVKNTHNRSTLRLQKGLPQDGKGGKSTSGSAVPHLGVGWRSVSG
jgi:hypothetical protein